MSMPALQRFRQQHRDAHLAILVKPPLASLWKLQPAVDEVLILEPGNAGLLRTAAMLRKAQFHTAYIFPNSWRSALVVYLAAIPERIGAGGPARRPLLTLRIRLSKRAHTQHQQWEYADILQIPSSELLPVPQLAIHASDSVLPPAETSIKTVGLIPGAARGPSKQWPESCFLRAAHLVLQTFPDCRFAIFGTTTEMLLCQRLASALPASSVMLAGGTTLPQFAASLAACTTVICNDSGGMHLASVVGTPVIAVYGLTDPDKTGPLGTGHQCIQADHVRASRSIARRAPDAVRALNSITPERVAEAAIYNLYIASARPL